MTIKLRIKEILIPIDAPITPQLDPMYTNNRVERAYTPLIKI